MAINIILAWLQQQKLTCYGRNFASINCIWLLFSETAYVIIQEKLRVQFAVGLKTETRVKGVQLDIFVKINFEL